MNIVNVNMDALEAAVVALVGTERAGMIQDLYHLLNNAEQRGRQDGYSEGKDVGYKMGFAAGHSVGWDQGYRQGDREGFSAAMAANGIIVTEPVPYSPPMYGGAAALIADEGNSRPASEDLAEALGLQTLDR